MADDTDTNDDEDAADDRAGEVGEALGDRRIAVAESLTGGLLANALARAEGSSDWFLGSVVSYHSDVKHGLLDVRPGPVVAEEAAVQMAESAARLLEADVAVAVTGAGGPDPQDGQEPGTVWVAVTTEGETVSRLHHFDGEPPDICQQTVVAALDLALEQLTATS